MSYDKRWQHLPLHPRWPAKLSPTATRVVFHTTLGYSIRQTAAEMDLADDTVRKARREAFKAFGVRSAGALAARVWMMAICPECAGGVESVGFEREELEKVWARG